MSALEQAIRDSLQAAESVAVIDRDSARDAFHAAQDAGSDAEIEWRALEDANDRVYAIRQRRAGKNLGWNGCAQ